MRAFGHERFELRGVFGHMPAEIAGRERTLDRAAAQIERDRAVRGEQRDVDAVFKVDVAHFPHINLVVAEAAVFVFHLQHNHIAAVRNLTGHDMGEQRLQVARLPLDEARVAAAQPEVVIGQQVGGHTAELPFGADERAGAHDGVQTDVGGEVEEAADVEHARKIEFAGRFFMQIPGGVGLHGIEAAVLELFQPVAPLVGVGAEIVDGAGENRHRLAVQRKNAVGG